MATSIFRAAEALITWASRVSFFAGAIAIVFMMLHIGGDVIVRSLFGVSLPGTLEITAQWYMIAIVFMPLALLQLRGDHIAVDLFVHGLSRRTQDWLNAMTSAAALVFFYFWADASLALALKKTKRLSFLDSGLWQIPTWPVYWACFAAVVLLFLATIIVTVRSVIDARTGQKPAHDWAIPHE